MNFADWFNQYIDSRRAAARAREDERAATDRLIREWFSGERMRGVEQTDHVTATPEDWAELRSPADPLKPPGQRLARHAGRNLPAHRTDEDPR